MNFDWAAEVDKEHLSVAARLRLQDGIEVAESDSVVWLRGSSESGDSIRQVMMIPRAKLFHLQDGNLRPWGKRLAIGRLPDIAFVPIAEFFQPVLPTAAFVIARPQKASVRMVRCSQPHAATILVTSATAWASYAAGAPKIRLERWAFALANDGRVVIRGEPLPPLPGQQFHEIESVAIPVGWACSPSIEGPVLSRLVEASENKLVLMRTDGTTETIPNEDFVRATRSSIHQTFFSTRDSAHA